LNNDNINNKLKDHFKLSLIINQNKDNKNNIILTHHHKLESNLNINILYKITDGSKE